MNTTLSPADLPPLLARADRAATSLSRRHRLSWFDRDDARQDLLLDLLARLRHHDAERGPLTWFAVLCFRNRSRRLDLVLRREAGQRHALSLDAVVPGAEHLTLADTLGEEDGIGPWVGQDADPTARAELHHDLDRALGSVDGEAVRLCTTLLRDGPVAGAVPGAASRATVHRRVRDLRCRLLAAGVGPAVKRSVRGVGN